MADHRPKSVRCASCDKTINIRPTGRVAKYCGNACRQAAFYRNHRSPLSADDRQRLLTWELLQDAGIVPRDATLPASGGDDESNSIALVIVPSAACATDTRDVKERTVAPRGVRSQHRTLDH